MELSKLLLSHLLFVAGTIFLWLFWPSFNGGLASGNAQYRAIINTYFSLTGSVVATCVFTMFVHGNKKIDMVRRPAVCSKEITTMQFVTNVQPQQYYMVMHMYGESMRVSEWFHCI